MSGQIGPRAGLPDRPLPPVRVTPTPESARPPTPQPVLSAVEQSMRNQVGPGGKIKPQGTIGAGSEVADLATLGSGQRDLNELTNTGKAPAATMIAEPPPPVRVGLQPDEGGATTDPQPRIRVQLKSDEPEVTAQALQEAEDLVAADAEMEPLQRRLLRED